MNTTLNIALIQSSLVWENSTQNLVDFEKKINAIDSSIDIIILPEMFTTGFTMNAVRLSETMDGKTMQWLKHWAKEKKCAICGSFIIEEGNSYYNRFIFMKPDGEYHYYDKHHLFTLAKENEVFTTGTEAVIITYKDWKIKPQICYDLRFPVWVRNTGTYDVLLYVASWPKLRISAWDTLLKARAIENMAYCIGVNRVGLDGNGYEYNGHSAAYDVLGNTLLVEKPIENETVVYVTLDKSHIDTTREKLPFLDDADRFKLL